MRAVSVVTGLCCVVLSNKYYLKLASNDFEKHLQFNVFLQTKCMYDCSYSVTWQ